MLRQSAPTAPGMGVRAAHPAGGLTVSLEATCGIKTGWGHWQLPGPLANGPPAFPPTA